MKLKPDKDPDKDPDNPKDYFKGVKIPLRSILKNPEINSSKILDTVLMANKIVTHTLMFMKLYLLHHYKQNQVSMMLIDIHLRILVRLILEIFLVIFLLENK